MLIKAKDMRPERLLNLSETQFNLWSKAKELPPFETF